MVQQAAAVSTATESEGCCDSRGEPAAGMQGRELELDLGSEEGVLKAEMFFASFLGEAGR